MLDWAAISLPEDTANKSWGDLSACWWSRSRDYTDVNSWFIPISNVMNDISYFSTDAPLVFGHFNDTSAVELVNSTPFPLDEKEILPEVKHFAVNHGVETVVNTIGTEARKAFPRILDFSLTLENDPEEEWEYIRANVLVACDPQEALESLDRIQEWLEHSLPPEKLMLISVNLDFQENAST